MPSIHWYPGHIAKAERKLQEQASLVDIILEVIDARIPLSSSYGALEKLTNNKPRIIIMNKSDLADPDLNLKWQEYLKKEDLPVLLTSSNSPRDISSIISTAIEVGKPRINQLVAKGRLPRPIRAMVVGMPNVGKSSIINKLIKTTKATVGAKAGVTRITQWVRVNPKLEMMDTPGVLPTKMETQDKAVRLAFVNSISEKAYDYIEVAQELLAVLYTTYPRLLLNYYKLEDMGKPPTLEDIANSRNWILSGNNPDINRCAVLVLSDFRHGKIGRTTLESIPDNSNQ